MSSSPSDPKLSAADKAAVDNRSVQLNPNNPEYHKSRGSSPEEAKAEAVEAAAKSNPQTKDTTEATTKHA
tara:strand:- start:411 stop:620 length:210 start_codon:yes stop_codon:yes gene_type:complete